MPIHIFTEAERAKLDTFPEEITHDDLVTFFTLSEADHAQLPIYSASYNRLGFALQLCTLRFMGFVPEELTRIPPAVVEYVAEQIGVEPHVVKYGPAEEKLRRGPTSSTQSPCLCYAVGQGFSVVSFGTGTRGVGSVFGGGFSSHGGEPCPVLPTWGNCRSLLRLQKRF